MMGFCPKRRFSSGREDDACPSSAHTVTPASDAGYDASAHMTEETERADLLAPLGMLTAVGLAFLVGWCAPLAAQVRARIMVRTVGNKGSKNDSQDRVGTALGHRLRLLVRLRAVMIGLGLCQHAAVAVLYNMPSHDCFAFAADKMAGAPM